MQKPIYWQQQGMDRLCGVHCVNAALQGPFFNEVSLAQVALQLDKKQKTLMHEQGTTKQFLKYMQEQSGNVANDGYYSLQVLQTALSQLGLTMQPIKALKQHHTFICNSSDHWFAIKRINGVWYNLNSTNKRLPQIISDFYLQAFLLSVREEGYQIFAIEGPFPQSSPTTFQHYNENQKWLDARRIQKYHQKVVQRKNYKPNISGAGADTQMEKAIAESMGKKYEKYISTSQDSDWESGPKKVIKPFAGNGVALSGGYQIPYLNFQIDYQDFQIRTVVEMTLKEKFNNPIKNGKQVIFKMNNGQKRKFVFQENATIQVAYDYIWLEIKKKFYLVNFENKQVLNQLQIPLFALQDDSGCIIIIVVEQ